MQNTQAINVKAGSAVATGSVTVSDSMPGVPCPDPAGYKYVGARYVPLFSDPIEWDKGNSYEPLTIVTYQGSSYTSKQYVPVGIDIENEAYWALTGNYNAQFELYRQEVEKLKEMVLPCYDTVDDLKATSQNGGYAAVFGYYEFGDCMPFKVQITQSADGHSFALENGLYANHVKSGPLTPKQFGAKGDGVSDDTTAIKSMMKFSVPTNSQNWTACHPIFIEQGTYYVTAPIIDSSLGNMLMFSIDGAGWNQSVFKCTGDYLLNDDDVFGFSTIQNIGAIGNNNNMFLNYANGDKNSCQHVTFNNVRIQTFKTIVSRTGTYMASELRFNDCSISSCGSSGNPAKLFITNNSQSVNINFTNTDCESFTGIMFECITSPAFTWDGGSIIPLTGSTVINVPTNRSTAGFGPGNLPFEFRGARFELRGAVKLIDVAVNTYIVGSFIECSMGGSNHDNYVTPVITVPENAVFYFDKCLNLNNFNMSSTVNTSSLNNTTIYFNKCDLSINDFMENSTFNKSGALPYGCIIMCDDVKYCPYAIPGKTTTSNNLITYNDASGIMLVNQGAAINRTFKVNGYVRKLVLGVNKTANSFNVNFNLTYNGNSVEKTINIGNVAEEEIIVNDYIDTLELTTSLSSGAYTLYAFVSLVVERC